MSVGVIEPTIERVGVIETDLFCDACGFNLHTQAVWRDERLGLLVCRCPECGKHQAASERTTATNAWLRRVALLGVLAWALLGIGYTLGAFGFFAMTHAIAEDGLTYQNFESRDGRPVTQTYGNGTSGFAAVDANGSGAEVVPAGEVIMRRRLVPWLGGGPPSPASVMFGRPVDLTPALFVAGLLAAGGYAIGVIFSSGSWYYVPGRRWLWLLLPLFAAVTVTLLIRANDNAGNRYWGNIPVVDDVSSHALVVTVALVNIVVMAIGIRTGRALTRLLLCVFVPPKARQMLAFLWHCDGKTLPTPRSPGDRAVTAPSAPS